MRLRVHVAVLCLVALAAVLLGCSSGDLAHLLGGGALTPKIAVIVNYDTGTLGSYKVNASTGAITEIAASPFPTSMTNPWAIVLHPNGKWVYVADDSTPRVEAWSVDNSTGMLTFINAANDTNYVDWVSGMAITQDGKWVITADCNANLSVFSVNQNTGALTVAGGPFSPAAPPSCLNSVNVVNSKYVYVTGFDDRVWAFSINSSTGALSELPGSPFVVNLPHDAYTQIADMSGKFLYVGNGNGDITTSTINSDGSLTGFGGVSGNTSTGNLYQFAIDPRNKFMYTANNLSEIDGWTINTSTGVVTVIPGSEWNTGGAGGSNLQNVVVDPSGKFVYGSNWGGTANTTAGFSINQTTGALTPIAGSPFPNKGSMANSMVITH